MGHHYGKIKDWRFHSIWMGMKYRCTKPYNSVYKHYGGRGIKVCKRWVGYDLFHKDMYESYKQHLDIYGEKDTTIERINNDGNYTRKNCRWTTWKEQGQNRRNSVAINKVRKSCPHI